MTPNGARLRLELIQDPPSSYEFVLGHFERTWMARGNKLSILRAYRRCAPCHTEISAYRIEIYYVDHKIKVEAGIAEIGWANGGSQKR